MQPMAHLLCKTEPFKDLRFNLKPECRIGREPDNDIALDNGTVSGYHGLITLKDDQWEVRDLGSTNGISVNQREISHAVLVHGDQLEIGSIPFQFVDEAAVSTPDPILPNIAAPSFPSPDSVEVILAADEPVPAALPQPAAPPGLSAEGNPWYLPVAVAGFFLLGIGILWYLKILWAP